jgi:HEAT repeat protein
MIGRAAVPHLVGLLKDDDSRIRTRAARGLSVAGPLAQDAVLPLIKLVDDAKTGRDAITTLGAIGHGAKAAIPRLLQELKSESMHMRGSAAVALGSIDREGETVDALIDLLDDDWYAAGGAAIGLRNIGPKSQTAVPALIMTLRKGSTPYVRYHAAEALGMIGPAAHAAIPALTEALKEKRTVHSFYDDLPKAAAEALRRIKQ